MLSEQNDYKWVKITKGVGLFAIVSLTVSPSLLKQNVIVERYTGHGFSSQGHLESVPAHGYDSWKLGALCGLEYGLSPVDTYWEIFLLKIEGRVLTDTNPTVVAYTTLRAFLDAVNVVPDNERLKQLEDFVLKSWEPPYKELIPNFFTLTFTEFSAPKK